MQRMAREFRAVASELHSDHKTVGQNLSDARWQGPDAEKLRHDWESQAAFVVQVQDRLTEAANYLEKEAEQQRRISEQRSFLA